MGKTKFRKAAGAAVALALTAFAMPTHAIVIADGAADQSHIDLANSFAYSSVGQIYGTSSNGAFAASGVLIASEWVLTAAHVTSGASSLTFFLDSGGTDFSRSGGVVADRIYTHSGWDGNLNKGYDIGLFHLSSAASCLANGSCQTAQRYTGTSEVGREATAVGFGMTGTGSTGATEFDGLKRAGTNVVDTAASTPGKSNRIILTDFDSGLSSDNSYGSAAALAMESMIAPGDSGGGLFELIGGTEFLAGITSFGWGRLDGNPDSDYGDVGGFTRVTYFNSWIDSIIGGGGQSGGGQPGGGKGGGPKSRASTDMADFALAVPEPISGALFGIGLLGLGLMRRGKVA